MNCQDIKNSNLSGLSEKITVKATTNGCILRTSHLDPSNDPIEVYIEEIGDNKFRVSDLTRSMEYLFLNGIDIKPESKQSWHLNVTLKRLKVELKNDELYVDVPKNELVNGIVKLIDAVNSVDNLIYTSRVTNVLDFKDEVANWLSEQNIKPDRNVELLGDSGRFHRVDFVIHRFENADDLTNKSIVRWLELERAKNQFHSICILDDTVEEDIWGAYINYLRDILKLLHFGAKKKNYCRYLLKC